MALLAVVFSLHWLGFYDRHVRSTFSRSYGVKTGQKRVYITYLKRRIIIHKAFQMAAAPTATTTPYQKYIAKSLPTIGEEG